MTRTTEGVAPDRLTPDEVAAVLERHEAMCWWVARRVCPRSRRDLVEDAAAVVRCQFVRAASTFDPARGMKFSTYALDLAVISARRWVSAELRRGIHLPVSLDDGGTPVTPPSSFGTATDPAAPAGVPVTEVPPDFWERLSRHLDEREAEILRLRYRDGLSYVQIGRHLGRSHENVRQSDLRACRKIRRNDPGLAECLC